MLLSDSIKKLELRQKGKTPINKNILILISKYSYQSQNGILHHHFPIFQKLHLLVE